jgi:hypothetical protein
MISQDEIAINDFKLRILDEVHKGAVSSRMGSHKEQSYGSPRIGYRDETAGASSNAL